MSQENVEIVKRWINAYNSRDNDALVGITDPDFEFRSYFVSIESLFRGYEAWTPTSRHSMTLTTTSLSPRAT
jgi:hypothetical protein